LRYIVQVIKSFRNRDLKRFWTTSAASGLRPDWVRKIERQLTLLDAASKPEEMNVVTFGFHALTGERYAITVSRNWRLTFAFDDHDVIDVDLEDYHGQ
jgi:toxin HigB-1